ncbi:MAG: hypothetical protein ACOC44_14840 [Promethearchaeia archaeon]
MILEIPDSLQGIGYYEGASLILWLISFGLLILAFLLFLKKGLETELKSSKMVFYGYGIFCLAFAITRILFIFGIYNPSYYGFYTNLGYISALIGIIFWLYILETYMITGTKKIFLILTLIAFGFALISLAGAANRYFALTIIFILLPVSITAIFLLYIYIIIKGTGSVRKKAMWLLGGLILFVIGYMMDSELFISNFSEVPLVIPPVIMIVGILVFLYSQLKTY